MQSAEGIKTRNVNLYRYAVRPQYNGTGYGWGTSVIFGIVSFCAFAASGILIAGVTQPQLTQFPETSTSDPTVPSFKYKDYFYYKSVIRQRDPWHNKTTYGGYIQEKNYDPHPWERLGCKEPWTLIQVAYAAHLAATVLIFFVGIFYALLVYFNDLNFWLKAFGFILNFGTCVALLISWPIIVALYLRSYCGDDTFYAALGSTLGIGFQCNVSAFCIVACTSILHAAHAWVSIRDGYERWPLISPFSVLDYFGMGGLFGVDRYGNPIGQPVQEAANEPVAA